MKKIIIGLLSILTITTSAGVISAVLPVAHAESETCPTCGKSEHYNYQYTKQEATCTEAGIEDWFCSDTACGSHHNVTVPALGHDYSKRAILGRGENVASGDIYDCTTEVTAYYLCSRCDAIGTDTFVYRAAGAHTWGEWETTTAATCTASGVQTRSCTTCAESETQAIPATGHSWGEWMTGMEPDGCDSDGSRYRVCSVCNEEDVEFYTTPPHQYGEPVYIPATCTSYAKNKYTCSACGDVYYEEAGRALAEHNYTVLRHIDATCTSSGIHDARCSVCGKTSSSTLPALGHDYTKREILGRGENIASGDIYSCTDEVTAYYLCTRCDAIGTETFVYREAGSHTWGEWETTTAATCTTDGVQTRSCTTCAESETQTISATGHSYGAWRTVTAATCTATGSRVRECPACGDHQTETIPTIPHDYTKRGDTLSDIASGDIHDCTQPIIMYYRCTMCDGHGTATYVYREAGDHDIQKFYEAPTCTITGVSGEQCVNCGYTVKADILPALGHNFVDRVCTRCGIEADFILIFYNYNGTKIIETTCEKGSTIDFPDDPDRKGYSFAGWFWYDDTGEYVKVSKYLTVQSDMEIYAYFDPIKINVYITDTVTGKTTTYTVLDGYTLGESLRTVSHSGYRFTGYTRDGANIPFSANTPITEELHLTANYEITFFGKALSFFKGLSVWTLVIIVVVIVLFLVLTKSGKSGSRRSSRRRRK